MPLSWTPDQVILLAPDEASRKNASGLANPGKWMRLFKARSSDQPVVWGECLGSSADPYRCQVDLDGPAFSCSCPSHKLPCKHALGLLLLYAGQPGAFEVSTPPDWVTAWLSKRKEQGNQKVKKTRSRDSGPDQAAKNRRAAGRDQKIRAGLEELETWLCDLLRQGLTSAQTQPRTFWESAAARLVDAQAPGLARMVRSMPGLAVSGEGWQERLLDQAARLYLAIEGYRRIETLPAENQADLQNLVGIVKKQEDLQDAPCIFDTWQVLGREVEEEAGLRTQRTWLRGQNSARLALVLSFAPLGGSLDGSLIPGTALPAELVFYPGAYPLRALVRSREPAQSMPLPISGSDSLLQATAGYAAALSAYPWLERYPMVLSGMRPQFNEGEWSLVDSQNRCIPLAKHFAQGWTIQALCGGHPAGLFGEWNGERLFPLSMWTEQEFLTFRAKIE